MVNQKNETIIYCEALYDLDADLGVDEIRVRLTKQDVEKYERAALALKEAGASRCIWQNDEILYTIHRLDESEHYRELGREDIRLDLPEIWLELEGPLEEADTLRIRLVTSSYIDMWGDLGTLEELKELFN